MSIISRRQLLAMMAAGTATAGLSACASYRPQGERTLIVSQGTYQPEPAYEPEPYPQYGRPSFGPPEMMYAATTDEGYNLPAIPYQQIDPRYYRQVVPDPTGEAPGTVVIDTSAHYLYLVGNFGQAIRYGVGLGRAGFEWDGRGEIQWKQKWPRWFPPDEMIARQPELAKYRARQIPGKNEWEGGMQPGVQNPLGARALYIFQNGKDTLYRLHGSPEWWSIGKSVSSGCVRLMAQDIIDLYERVPDHTPIVVTSGLPGYV